MCDGKDQDRLVGGHIADVVWKSVNTRLTDVEIVIGPRGGSTDAGPSYNRFDCIVYGGQKGETETGATSLIPTGRFSKFDDGLGLEAEPAAHPDSSSAIR